MDRHVVCGFDDVARAVGDWFLHLSAQGEHAMPWLAERGVTLHGAGVLYLRIGRKPPGPGVAEEPPFVAVHCAADPATLHLKGRGRLTANQGFADWLAADDSRDATALGAALQELAEACSTALLSIPMVQVPGLGVFENVIQVVRSVDPDTRDWTVERSSVRAFTVSPALTARLNPERFPWPVTETDLRLPAAAEVEGWAVIDHLWPCLPVTQGPDSLQRHLAGLTTGQRALAAVAWTRAEVLERGFDAFFYDDGSVLVPDAWQGLQHIGAGEYADVAARAMAIFPNGAFPYATDLRRLAMRTIDGDTRSRLLNLSNEWRYLCEDEPLDALATAYVAGHRDEFFVP